MLNMTAGTDEQDRGTAARRRPPCPVPAGKGRCPVPLCAVLYPPPRRGTLAGQGRGARPGPQGPGKGGPASAGRAYGPPAMPGPAPGRTPAKQPPAAPRRIHQSRRTNAARKTQTAAAGNTGRPAKNMAVIHPELPIGRAFPGRIRVRGNPVSDRDKPPGTREEIPRSRVITEVPQWPRPRKHPSRRPP
jgi:hypothetical protein